MVGGFRERVSREGGESRGREERLGERSALLGGWKESESEAPPPYELGSLWGCQVACLFRYSFIVI